jgi:hypothetical protein
MEPVDSIPESPNLDALSAEYPRRRLTVIRLLWPKIRACLARGHTVREIREKLRLDGIEVNYKNLCACIAELRERDQNSNSRTAALESSARKSPDGPRGRGQADPLENVRRLTEDKRPGFNYSGTLNEKDLFGK